VAKIRRWVLIILLYQVEESEVVRFGIDKTGSMNGYFRVNEKYPIFFI
jgi:hypothetical protein